MNYIRTLFLVALSITLRPVYTKNLPSLSSMFDRNKETKIVKKEYRLGEWPRVTVQNTENGTVDVETREDQDTVVATVTIKTKKEEQLDLVTYVEKADDDTITLTTKVDDDGVKCSVHYQLVVPPLATITIENKNGNVNIQEIQGKVCAHTTNGDITFNHCSSTTVARVESKGNIYSNDASGHVKAYTKKGKICVNNSSKSVLAHTEQGPITVAAQQVPSRSKINLSSAYGSVTLELPEKINADLYAKSERGIITCQHEVTLKPITTTLTSADWKQMKRTIDGTIGSGTSEIRVSSNQNIKIKKNQTA